MRTMILMATLTALGGCAVGFYHVAADGTRVDKDPAVLKKFEVDGGLPMRRASSVPVQPRCSSTARSQARNSSRSMLMTPKLGVMNAQLMHQLGT